MGQLAVTFDSYLSKLRSLEGAKPKEMQRDVPTSRQIALSVGLPTATGHRLMNGSAKSVNLSKVAMIIDDMRARGFNTELTDFFTYMPDSQLAEM